MRVIDGRTGEVLVGRDPDGSFVELEIAGSMAGESRFVRLSGEEARRLASLILFQAGRLDRAPRLSVGRNQIRNIA